MLLLADTTLTAFYQGRDPGSAKTLEMAFVWMICEPVTGQAIISCQDICLLRALVV